MGLRGPAPKPVELKILEGNPGKRKLNRQAPKPVPIAPNPPDWLAGEALACFHRNVHQLERLDLMTQHDLEIFVGFCVAWGEFAAWAQKPAEERAKDAKKGQDWLKVLKILGAEFGMSPSSRGRLVIQDRERNIPSKFGDLLK